MKTATTENEKELLETLHDVISQACWSKDGLDSMALTAYAIGMHVLAEYGVIKIKDEYGRRVIAEDAPAENGGSSGTNP